MSKLQWAFRQLPQVLKYGMVLGVVFLISFLFPEQVSFKYTYEEGQIWRNETLYAPFDFTLLKSEAEIEAARARIRNNFSPYYEYDPDVVRRQKQEFVTAFQDRMAGLTDSGQFTDVRRYPERYRNYALAFLDRIYRQGVPDLAPAHAERGEDFVINVVRGGQARPRTKGSLLTVQQATELLTDSLPYTRLREPEFLMFVMPQTIKPNLFYNDTLSEALLQQELDGIVTSEGAVREGAVVIANGSPIGAQEFNRLRSFERAYQQSYDTKRSRRWVFAGYFLLTGLLMLVYVLYLREQAPQILQHWRQLAFVMSWFLIYAYLVYSVEQTTALSSYLIPFCIVPIVIKNFYSNRIAFYTHVVIVLIASFLSRLGYEFTFIQILAGMVAVLVGATTRDWSRFFLSMLLILASYVLAFLALGIIQEGDIASIDWGTYRWLFLNVVLTLLAYTLIPLVERVFGFTSDISLVELSDMNRPLLRDLSLKAPGTLQHSLQVANLAEAAVTKIGGNALLVKTAALYHDIGKMQNPQYYTENQAGNSPHDQLSNVESAKMIIAHVTEGVKMAKKAGLPAVLIDFIRTHHGTTRTEYFYRNHVKENPETGEADEALFRYPGPRPRSKEETILMIADSLEAASKSLKAPTAEAIDSLVDNIIAGKIKAQQFELSALTFEELEMARQVIKQMLKSIHHVRIAYPDEVKKPEVPEKAPPTAG